MSVESPPNRWIPFQCPACSGLFRIRKNDVGRTGRCPVCQAAVETVEKTLLNDPAPEAVLQESKREMFEKVADAHEMTQEEKEAHEAAMQNRKRVYAGGSQQSGTGWEDRGSGSAKGGVSWKVWVSGLMVLGLITTFGVRYMTSRGDQKGDGFGDGGVAGMEKMLEGFQETGKPPENVPKEDEITTLIDRYKEFDLGKVEESVKGFLLAKTVAEKKLFVRDSDRVIPLMDDHYSKIEYEAEGFESLNRLETNYRGELVITSVQTGDFLSRFVTVERVKDEEGERYFVDWESWVGYCEKTPEEMRNKKPTKPFLIRTVVEAADYYNYGFSDDAVWCSYGLEIGDSGFLFLGYVPRNSELDKKLSIIRERNLSQPMILRVAYPPKARAKDQVEILEVIPSNGWLLGGNKKDNDE